MDFCENCLCEPECKQAGQSCTALKALVEICREQDKEEKRELIRDYARKLGVIQCEVSPELQRLGESVINGLPDLQFIKEYDIKVGYVMSYERKRSGRKLVNADCRKVTGTYLAYLPFDFVITFYEPNMSYMTDNQQKILMYHELKHIGIGEKGLRIEDHDIVDFHVILHRYGLTWDGFRSDVPDILAGGDDGEEEAKIAKEKGGRKRQKVAT